MQTDAETAKLFLFEGHMESGKMLKAAIHGRRPAFWDNIVVTTAAQAQADLYRQFIDERIRRRYIPSVCKYLVEPDRDEKRIGSGGSTLCVLAKLFAQCGFDTERLLREKNLVLHSGGDAKRLPHSAPFGKLFTLSGTNIGGDVRNPPGTVFDDLMISLAGLPSRMSGGIIVVSADAFFRFNHTQFDLNTLDAAALAMRAPAWEGAAHGVFLERGGDGFVAQFLHKLPEEELRLRGAVSDTGNVDLDIGITYLGEKAITALLELILDGRGGVDEGKLSQYANERVRLSFYGDIIYPMAGDSTLESFLGQAADGPLTPELLSLRPAIFQRLHPVRLRILRPTPGRIRNMGTTEEALDTLRFFHEEARFSGGPAYDANIALNSGISKKAVVGENCFIENSRIRDGAKIGANCLVSGCDVFPGFEAPDDTAFHCVKLKDGKWVCRVWGVRDDIKSNAAWLGKPLRQWDCDADSLWNARLFPVCDNQKDALEWAGRFAANAMTDDASRKWRASVRLSLADTACMDAGWLLTERKAREDIFRVDAFVDNVLGGSPVDESVGYLGTDKDACRRIALLQMRLENEGGMDWRDTMRLNMCVAEAAELLGLDLDIDGTQEKGFAVLSRALAGPDRLAGVSAPGWKNRTVEVALPVRVNWGGTWSDAPPYCVEHGGTMLNAAVSMDGKLPIFVRAERLDEPVVEFASMDLNMEKRHETLEPLLAYRDPTDAFILFKAALAMAGVLAPNRGTLKEQLLKMGGGVRITTKVDVPKGSGLGTSSILTGALIDALAKLSGRTLSGAELSDDVLLAEQLMTTGGGWQDAIGGMYPGIKLTFTNPGIPQKYDVQSLVLPDGAENELNRRGFLLYTGQRRLARSVLRRVMSNYVCNHRESIAALNETQRLAVTMAYELRRGNIGGFGRLLSGHMALLRRLDASSSNSALDYIMDGLAGFAEGVTLCGAAGGGFMYGVAKDGVSLHDIGAWLGETFEGSQMRLYAADIL